MSGRKKYFWLILIVALIAAGFWIFRSYRGQIKPLPAALKDTLAIDIPISVFRIPITFSIEEFEGFINDKFKGEFLETTLSPTKNEKDQVKVEMRKISPITITAKGKNLLVIFPLKVTATILHTRLNLITKGIKPVETDVVLELQTPADLDSGWNLVTKFSLERIAWIKPPILKLAGIDFNLKDMLDSKLQEKKDELCDLLDREVHKAVSLKKPVEKVWGDLQKPIVINKKPPVAYMKFMLQNIYGDLEIKPRELVCYTTIEAKVAMVTETKLRTAFIPLPAYRQKAYFSQVSDVFVYAFAEFYYINDELNEKLVGQSISGKNLSVKVEKANVFASDSGLAVALDTKGDIQTRLVATVVPEYDSITQSFKLNNFQFQMESANTLLSLGDAVLHDNIQDAIQKKLALGMDSLILKVPAIIENAIAKGKPGKTIDVEVDTLKILSCPVKLDAKRIHFLVHTNFVSRIEIKEIQSKKSIRIKPKKI